MAKSKVAYVCNECGAEFSRWQGQCGECKAWNTITEIRLGPSAITQKGSRAGYAGELSSKVQTLSDVSLAELPRISSGYKELDRVLGGHRPWFCHVDWGASGGREKYFIVANNVFIGRTNACALCDG